MSSEPVLLRYRYPDGRLQAALPLRVVERSPDTIVGWLSADTEISYWATSDGSDPRTVPLEERFHQPLGTARRRWEGGGVLRVIPIDEFWQVLHFWDPTSGEFLGWYVNLESRKRVAGTRIDSVDWHLDLLISPSFEVRWKDIDEAAAAMGTEYLRRDDLATAQAVGDTIVADPRGLIDRIGDWRDFVPSDAWGPLALPHDWTSSRQRHPSVHPIDPAAG